MHSSSVSHEEATDAAAKLAAVAGAIEMALTAPGEDYSPAEKQALLARIVRRLTRMALTYPWLRKLPTYQHGLKQ
jgi:hypothetical protein